MDIRVLHSFPLKIGASRICTTAWHEVAGVAAAGGDVTVYPGAVQRPLPADVAGPADFGPRPVADSL